jgi:putative ABC transport system ATP-binding protein
MDLLRRVASDHAAAILVVTHDEKVFGSFDRLVRLRDGRMEMDTSYAPASIAGSPITSRPSPS